MKYKLTLIAAFIAFSIVGKGQTNEKVVSDSTKKIFTVVQIEAEFPGGLEGWKKFLETNLNTSIASDKGAPEGRYTVMLSFLVDKDGSVSNVTTENNPGYGTAEECIRIMRKSPKWKPALQNGRIVSYRARQAITFMVTKDK